MPTIITRGAGSASGYGFANSVTATFSITAGIGYSSEGTQGTGYNYGDAYYYSAFGSCTPAFPSPFAGAKFRAAYNQDNGSGTPIAGFILNLDGFASDPGQNWFKSIAVTTTIAPITTTTLLASAAYSFQYDFDGGGTGNTIWVWLTGVSTLPTIVVGRTYTVKLIK